RLPNPDSARLPRLPLLGMGMLFGVIAMLAFFALERVPASTFVVLVYAYPAVVAILSLFTGEFLSTRGWIALGLTLVGVLMTVPDFTTGLAESDPIGILLSIMNAITYGIYLVISNRLLRGQTALAQASAYSISGSLILLVIVALFNGLAIPQNWTAWGCVFGIAIFSTVIPIFSVYTAMQKLGATRASILSMLEPVLVLLFSFLFLDETMKPIQLAGGALILVSAITLQINVHKPRQSNEPQTDDILQPEIAAL
ncbi:MAG: EamA family transporter, partial [Chitinophagaceae bacterium]|nr:EamA family transporter [Anaerolineae bacterium]